MAPRGNDAIPSWSGFNYQGKIMLLYVMQLINSLPECEIDNYQLELEAREDFTIIKNGSTVSFHQVKAYLSTDKWISYSDAINKLLSHRNSSDSPTAKCYLMTAKDILDWEDSSNSYCSSVKLYKYSGKIVGVTDVKNFLKAEIDTFLTKASIGTENNEIVYSSLCLFLEDKIAEMHKQSIKKRVYTINFKCIIKNIENSLYESTIREEYNLKEKVFDFAVEQIKRACEQCCSGSCKNSFDKCVLPCAVKEVYERILTLNDLVKYCRVLVPNRKDGWDNVLTILSYLNINDIHLNIFHVFKESKTPHLVQENNNVISLRSKFCNVEKQSIIPTLLNLSPALASNSLQEIFQDIKNNKEILEALDGNAITAVPGNYLGSFSQAEITSSWAVVDPTLIGDFYKGIEIISVKDLLKKFEDNGGNCE